MTLVTLVLTALLAAPLNSASPPGKNEAALNDAKNVLLGPCSPDMAEGKVTAIKVVDSQVVNAATEKDKSGRSKAVQGQVYIAIKYSVRGKTEEDFRQVNAASGLTTAQAQALVGEKVCVVRYKL